VRRDRCLDRVKQRGGDIPVVDQTDSPGILLKAAAT
jgi:hypothetical protein